MTKTPDTAISSELLKAAMELIAKGKVKPKRSKPSPAETEARKSANDAECVRVFTEAGYTDVQPRVNVLTYGKVKGDGTVTGWLGKGRKVRSGEKSLQVGPFRLFHIDQTDPIEAEGTVH